jgi:hypothetical protein
MSGPPYPERLQIVFCYCCGRHFDAMICGMCGTSACATCIAWAYLCRKRDDAFCRNVHRSRTQCNHRDNSLDPSKNVLKTEGTTGQA